MQKKQFCILTNCQGAAILKALYTCKEFNNTYETYGYPNYITNEITETIQKGIMNADVILYQPLSKDSKGVYCTDDLLKYKKESAIAIGFPYIYCNWLWNFYMELSRTYSYFFDNGIIRELKKTYTSEEILSKFKNNEIDFKLEERKHRSLAILREKEKYTDIKVADYIDNNYKTKQLFNIPNHPTHHIFIHCANQVLQLLSIDYIIPENTNIGEYNDYKYFPIDQRVKETLQLTYCDQNKDYYLNLLTDVLNDFREIYPGNHHLKLCYFDHLNKDIYKV